jgi:hypothetical protein
MYWPVIADIVMKVSVGAAITMVGLIIYIYIDNHRKEKKE